MNWQEVCADAHLHNLPFKIELNEYGQVVMSPIKVYHSAFQGRIGILLYQLLNGYVLDKWNGRLPPGDG